MGASKVRTLIRLSEVCLARGVDSTQAGGALRRRRLSWLLAAGVAVLGGAGLLWWRASSQRPQYVTAAVTRGNVRRSVNTTGALNPVVTVQVGSYVSGPIKTLKCDFNTEVVVGQLCAQIDPVPFQLIVDQDRAEVGTAEAQLKKDQAALAYAKIAFERDSKLLAEGTVSQDTVDNDRSVRDQTTAQLGLDRATIVNKQAVLKAAEVNLAYTHIVSPVVGTVITRNIDVGQTVAASLQSPTLFLIGRDLTKMQVDTNVSEADVGAVRLGQDVVFTVQAFPGKTFRGKVTQIRRGPITVQNVVTYDAVVAVDNPDRLLFPGMTADTHVVIDEHDGVLRVPLPAVRFTPEGIGRERETAQAGGEGPAAGAGAAGTEDRGRARAEGGSGAEVESRPAGRRESGGGGSGEEARSGPGGEGRRRRWSEGRPEGRGEGRPEGRGAGRPEGRTAGRPGGRGRGTAERRGRVWVLSHGTLRPVAVTIGLDDGTLVEVSGKGLAPGDKVVVNEIKPGEQRQRAAPPNQQNQVLRQGGPRL
ncbi:MAG TPA: efflux RND transporter periplasmic adaptor subunit [Thermoanaerobaculia bacterium]|nr:efflux RND transporter periplasmic adaptor subunit [Thermoanaerobaculia bacterium]